MSNDYQKPFFLEVPSHFFRCTDKLHSVRDNLLIELACNSASFMIRGPRLLLQGLQVRITNRSQQQKNALHLTIRIEPRIIFDLDTHKINDDF